MLKIARFIKKVFGLDEILQQPQHDEQKFQGSILQLFLKDLN